jgi:hypothetical protein
MFPKSKTQPNASTDLAHPHHGTNKCLLIQVNEEAFVRFIFQISLQEAALTSLCCHYILTHH